MVNTAASDNYVPYKSGKLVVPKVGELTTVTLPGEILRAEVVEIVDDDHIVCQIGQPMSKAHNYRKDQRLTFHRAKGMMREHWEAD